MTSNKGGNAADERAAAITDAVPWGLALMRRAYFRVMRLRDALFSPLTWILAAARVSPNTLSYSGVVAMGTFVIVLPLDPLRALYLLIIAFGFDLADGALARRLGKESDRGKFTDMVCDSLAFTLFLVGLVHAGLLEGLAGLGLAYMMLLSKVLRAVRNAVFLDTDWHFKAVAGFVPNSIVGLLYVLFVVYVATGRSGFPYVALPALGFLGADGIFFYVRILAMASPKNSAT